MDLVTLERAAAAPDARAPDAGGNSAIPADAPLAMPHQDFARRFLDSGAPSSAHDDRAFALRLAMFAATAATTGYFVYEMTDILAKGGLSPLELVMAIAFAASFMWIALAAVNATAGAVHMAVGGAGHRRRGETVAEGLSVALLVPTCNEHPPTVFGNAVAMLASALAAGPRHRFALFVLSDTTDPAIAAAEREALEHARRRLPEAARLYYRRRENNAGRKAGNIAEWCRRWGGGHDAMIVLDADSLMDGEAILGLADALAADSSAGLIQSAPRLINAHTAFARMQQFAAAAHGPMVTAGLSSWSRGEANYWGHNAIIRTRAFAASAGLPELAGRRPFAGHILSHDFVEAALMRRAGWRVYMAPAIAGSYEETPPTLIDHVIRDRRWCQGNLQHLAVVGAAGLHPLSRFHLFQGMMAYISSALWLLFLVAGAAVAIHAGAKPVDYFPEPYVLFPTWPMLDADRAITLLALTGGVLIAPKVLGVAAVLARPSRLAHWGGALSFVTSAVVEIVLTALIAPVLMVQQTRAVFRTLAGIDGGWQPQRRAAHTVPIGGMARFHGPEIALGAALSVAIGYGVVPLWLAPIAASLVLVIPISILSGLRLGARHPLSRLFAVPDRLRPPAILRAAKAHGLALARAMRGDARPFAAARAERPRRPRARRRSWLSAWMWVRESWRENTATG